MTVEVHQFLPSFAVRDASGNHTMSTQDALALRGYSGAIWAEDIHPELSHRARPYVHYAKLESAKRGGNVLLYQAGTGSRGMVDFLMQRPESKLIYYHNITPSEFFEPYDPFAAAALERGRLELRALCAEVVLAMANSSFSAQELSELGVKETVVVPPYLPPDLEVEADPGQSEWLRRTKRGIDVLFVGRIVPNKGHLHLLRAFAALRAGTDHQARLFCVGVYGPPLYMEAVRRLRDRLGHEGIVFTGAPSDETLAAHFREADVFVCLSEHEGFCLPLVSAMRAGLPVVAYDAGAVAETLGGAGVLLRTLDPLVVAEVVARVATDASLREAIVARQYERVAELEAVPRDDLIVECVERARK